MPQQADLLGVVEEIYEAAVEPAGLDKLAASIANALGSPSGFIGILARGREPGAAVPSMVGLPSATDNFDQGARTAYAEHYHRCNLWFERGVRKGFPAIVLGQELVTPEELLRSEWYEYCERLDAFHVIGAQFHVDRQFSGQFGAHLPRRSKAFDEASRRRMSLLLPHLQRALQIQIRLGLADEIGSIGARLIEQLDLGCLILDTDGHVVFANALAERMFETRKYFRVVNARVHALGPSAEAFEQMVREVARTSEGQGLSAGGMLHLADGYGGGIRLFVAPLPASTHWPFCTSRPAALILIRDLAPEPAQATPVDRLCQVFGLTRAEGLLVAGVATGESLANYAARSGIALETARTHAKRALSKSGYHRQIDLVRAIASDPMFRLG